MRIMKTSGLAGLCLFLLLSFAGTVFAAPQTTCPVMGGEINKEIYADHDGKRVYFCCAACIPKFEKDPEKYLAKLKEMGVEPEAVPAEGEEAAPAEHADHEGHENHSEPAK
jgi:YHS domain-containing protein